MVTLDILKEQQSAVAVVGLGYVGLPLAVALAKHYKVIGFDINEARVKELIAGDDRTWEVEPEALKAAPVEYTCDPQRLGEAGVIIVAVPTPIDGHRNPDLKPVTGASRTVGKYMSTGAVVVFESTVYPGLTEDVCAPILEAESGLQCGCDFTLGYSPERINPGDQVHTLETIVKVVAGQDEPTAELLCALYSSIIEAGVHKAPSIRVAEAAKVIENTQRDLNIALMNELALIFDIMDIDTREVLEAAGTKWNFLPFSPGLVGGHCIGVDPYYLTYKAQAEGYHPEVILAGRRTNDLMGKFVAEKCIKMLIKRGGRASKARVGVFGLTFKENVPDLRNTRVIDVIRELEDYTCQVLVHDPRADAHEAQEEYGLDLSPKEAMRELDAIIVCVPHQEFLTLAPQAFLDMARDPERLVVLDVRGSLDREAFRQADVMFWRL